VILLVFAKVGNFDFVSLDDDVHVYKNDHVTSGLTAQNVRWAFGLHGPGQWHPLAYMSHQFVYEYFGASPRPHHLVNLAFHLGSTIFLLLALRNMTQQLWPSALVATLFALHPLQVESVAWVCERRDVMFAFFWMVTLWVYAGYAKRGGLWRYLGVVLFCALAMMSKPMAVTLPCALLLLDIWPLKRVQLRIPRTSADGDKTETLAPRRAWKVVLIEKIPLLALSVLASILSILSHEMAIVSFQVIPIHVRIANALIAYVVYLRKFIWPSDLAVWYPHPVTQSSIPLSSIILPAIGAAILLLAVSAWVVYQLRRRPYLFVGWFWYLGVLFPVSGLFQVGMHAYADRFTYVPMIGICMAMTWFGLEIVSRWPYAKRAAAVAIPVLLVACITVTSIQLSTWRNSRTLYERALKVTIDNALIHNNLGKDFLDDHNLAEAKEHLEEALRIRGNYSEALTNLGVLFREKGELTKAKEYLLRGLKLNPRDHVAHYNLANVLESEDNLAAAKNHYQTALDIEPNHNESLNNLGAVYKKLGDDDAAQRCFLRAIEIRPDDALARNNLGLIFEGRGDLARAAAYYREAIELDPAATNAHYNLGNILFTQGQLDAAAAQYVEALRFKHDHLEAYYNLGNVNLKKGNRDKALAYFEQALRINPEFGEAHNNAGVILELNGKLEKALVHYKEAVRINPGNASAQENLKRASAALAGQNKSG